MGLIRDYFTPFIYDIQSIPIVYIDRYHYKLNKNIYLGSREQFSLIYK